MSQFCWFLKKRKYGSKVERLQTDLAQAKQEAAIARIKGEDKDSLWWKANP